MDIPIALLMDYSPQGLILIMLWVVTKLMTTINEIKENTDHLLGIIRKERKTTERYRGKLADEISRSNAQHVKIVTLLDIIHSETSKK